LRSDHALLQKALQSQLAVSSDSDSSSLGLPLAPGNVACCPCVSSGKPIGLLFIAREEKEAFDKRDLTILEVVSTRAAEALEIEHQISDHKHFFHRLTLLYQASHAIAKTHDLQETIKQVATHLLKASMADVCEVLVLEENEPNVSRFEQKTINGVTHTLASPRPDRIPDYSVHKQVLKDHQPALLSVAPPLGSVQDVILLQSEGYASVAVLPLAIQEQSFGFVRLLYKTKGRSISQQEMELSQAVISIGVIGLQDAIHFESSQSHANQLQILGEIGREMTSTLELENALQSAMRHAQRLLQAEAVVLFLLDEGRDQLVLKASGGSHVSIKNVAIPLNEGIAGWVTRNRTPLIVNDVRSNPHYTSFVDRQTGLLTTSVVCVPLEEHNRVLGVIEAINHPKGAFSQNDAQMLAAVASWAAIALDKAHLFRQATEERSSSSTRPPPRPSKSITPKPTESRRI
jgi:GAF domain-containing protein